MPVLDDAESKGNEEDVEAVLEGAAEAFFPPDCRPIEKEASCNNVIMLKRLLPLSAKALVLYRWILLCLITPFWAQRKVLSIAKHSLFINR